MGFGRIKRTHFIIFYLCVGSFSLTGQQKSEEDDAFMIKSFFEQALDGQIAYKWLHYLSEHIGGRIAGSPQSLAAVEFTAQVMDSLGTDTVFRLPCTVNYWYRGEKEKARIVNHAAFGSLELKCLALGGSGSTGPDGLAAEVIEFKSLDDLRAAGDKVKGKIVFLSRAFDNKHLRTFNAYGSAVDQRVFGPDLASKMGAAACIIRSMTGRTDDWPHTGVTIFKDSSKVIPALALSTKSADVLSQCLASGPTQVYLKATCENRGPKESYSVVGEIKGSKYPEEIILVGGHLDSWDVGGGAHDDGAGCVHSMEVMYLLNRLGYKPLRTIRCVLFQNEENGLAGGLSYAKFSNTNKEFHLAAIESDAGGFTPQGFGFDGESKLLERFKKVIPQWESLLGPYNITFSPGGGGADIGPLKSQGGMLIGLRPDSQRYFDYHHTEQDRIEAVHPRELALGSAAMASLVYLIDKYGIR
ncbi:MAG: M28 family peptidase [Saprospiraceae bacterium]|nr:M28 family peptidase [Saprospiraceae bacterium]